MTVNSAKFEVGQVVQHIKFGYRGVILDADAGFQGTDEWYERVARSQPPKDQPWYHVAVDDADHTTYVAERHLEADESGAPVSHMLVAEVFARFQGGRYMIDRQLN